METRIEKSKKRKKEIRKQVLSIPKMLIILIISFFIYILTLVLWANTLKGTAYYDLLDTILKIYIMTVGFFMGLGYMNLKFIIVLVKSLIKIMFTVWVVIIVQFSSMEQVEQNIWIILSAFFFVYLEVLLDINDCLFQVKDDFRIPKIKFLTSTFIKENSISLSIMCLGIINSILSFFIVDLLDATKLV
ncbi:hypothetical protein G5B47_20500 [Paenibacillus sp. 7124]|uniref:Uncharacterized protein n=1 Tax=Paenibacillus apii TaxID=1850370 RepID=A0A6M1PM99_9BACL|nr:hypothetical protein [Paenibacillus apii]NGM84787.1 hypothetical protein [Paenibacillus apii]